MAPKSDAGRMALLVMMVTAALAVAAGLLVYLNREPEYPISTEVFARLPPKAQQWVRRLKDEPCNRTLATQLVDVLLDQAEYGSIISFSDQTETKCGPNEELGSRPKRVL